MYEPVTKKYIPQLGAKINNPFTPFLPDIEPVYMSEKNSNHVKEIDDI